MNFRVRKAPALAVIVLSCLFLVKGDAQGKGGILSSSEYKIEDLVVEPYDSEFIQGSVLGLENQLENSRNYLILGYQVARGYQYLSSDSPFGFSLSETRIDFGDPKPNRPALKKITLSVFSEGVDGFRVTGLESQPLISMAGNILPDVTCDNQLCDESRVGTWNKRDTYGFGYSFLEADLEKGLLSENNPRFFRQFSNRLFNEPPATIYSSLGPQKTRPINLFFKINLSETQPSGRYQNSIIITAIPNY